MDGILNIYKEAGCTSFDVVARVRRILGIKKAGHTGTLDPEARGVLPVCVGRATKLSGYLTGEDKAYKAELLLGVCTDTLDIQGQVIRTCPVECTREEIEQSVLSFVGEYDQVPPMYSAIKKDGKRLYELAREGVNVKRAARRVEIKAIDIIEISPPRVRFFVECSKGTYIRSLCDDIGNALGCGGCMGALERTRSGFFSSDDARTLGEIEELHLAGEIEKALIPMDEALFGLPKAVCDPRFDNAARNGAKLPKDGCVSFEGDGEKTLCRLYDSGGKFIGIYLYSPLERLFRPERILCGGD